MQLYINLALESVLRNQVTEQITHCSNMIVSVTKQMLYWFNCACNKPKMNIIYQEIKFIRNLEMQKAITKNQVFKYNKQWNDNIQFDEQLIDWIIVKIVKIKKEKGTVTAWVFSNDLYLRYNFLYILLQVQ